MRFDYLQKLAVIAAAVAISLWLLTLPAAAAPQPVSSTDLIEHAATYDGQEIVFSGEAIGDLMRRGDYAWVNVSDGANAVGLWMSADLSSQIVTLGSHKHSGDQLVATGVFHRACAEHGGDFDIHVTSLSVTARGIPTPHPIARYRLMLAALLTALAVALFVADRRRGRAERRPDVDAR